MANLEYLSLLYKTLYGDGMLMILQYVQVRIVPEYSAI